jgi:hypothetical protein
MSDNQSAQSLSYQQVAKIADNIIASGKKVRIDLVRREIGFGDYAQIANYLRKWQNSSNKAPSRPQNKNLQRQAQQRQGSKGHRNNQSGSTSSGSNARMFHQYDDETFTTVIKSAPFCMETFMKENDSVKALFLSIYIVKQGVSEIVDNMRKEKAKSLSYRKQVDRDIRHAKMEARVEIRSLSSEITKIMLLKEHEIILLKSQI